MDVRVLRMSLALTVLIATSARADDDWAIRRDQAIPAARGAGQRSAGKTRGPTVSTRSRAQPAPLASDPGRLIALAERALAAGDRAAAVAAFVRLRSGSAATDELFVARILGEHDLLPEAIEHARKARARAPRDAEAVRVLASLLERAGRSEEADAAWQDALRQVETVEAQREARQHLAALWRRTGQLTQRTLVLEERLRAQPDDVATMRLLAELYARAPDKAEAERALLERLLARSPADEDALLSLERRARRVGDTQAALAAARRRLEHAREATEVASALELARQRPRDDAAQAIAERALVLAPRDAEVQRRVAELYVLRDQPERARLAYARAVELDPRDFRAREALARDASRRGEHATARVELEAIVLGSEDEAQIAAALALAGADGEPWLLELARAHPERTPLRRLWFERVLPMLARRARAAQAEAASDAEQDELGELLVGARAIVLAALADSDAEQRSHALAFLELAPDRAALAALLTLAERRTLALAERARALRVVGLLRDPQAVDRLNALRKDARTLRPLALWAAFASAPERVRPWLTAALEDRDEDTCALAIVLLGARVAEPRLGELADDPRPTVRAAALWALAQHDRGRFRAQLETGMSAPAPVSVAALAALADERRLAEALFAPDPALRRAAMTLLADHEHAVPSWPFSFADYLAQLAASPRAQQTQWIAALAEWLRKPEQLAEALPRFAIQHGGLVPSAFVEAKICASRSFAGELAGALREPLAQLTASARPDIRQQALALLFASGGEQRAEVQRALRTGTRSERHLLLELAAGLAQPLSGPLRTSVESLLAVEVEWPTRMRAARALRHTLTWEQLAHDPIALVRAAAREADVPRARPCEDEGALN